MLLLYRNGVGGAQAAGTQARRGSRNSLVVAKLSDIGQGRHGRRRAAAAGDSDDDSESSDEEDEELPVLHSAGIHVAAGVNRVRACPHRSHLVAAWLENGLVEVGPSPPPDILRM